jgi:methyltransferase-like protein
VNLTQHLGLQGRLIRKIVQGRSYFGGQDFVDLNSVGLHLVLFRDFRRTLLCHQDVTLNRKRLRDQLAQVLIASPLTQSNNEPDGAVSFRNQRGPGSLQTNTPIILAALQYLDHQWPQAVPFKELLAATLQQVAIEHHDEARSALIEVILKLACNLVMDLRSYPGSAIRHAGDRPVASSLARAQAKTGSLITTLLHTRIEIQDERTRRLLESLDGTRDRRGLVDYFLAQYQDLQRPELNKQIDKLIDDFGRLGLLVA